MKNALFYLLTVLIWGSPWLAIKFQLGVLTRKKATKETTSTLAGKLAVTAKSA